jgi:AcrR family transcriptional regulator
MPVLGMSKNVSNDNTAPGIRPPRQQRSKASLERVLAAGAELLVEQGYEGFTMPEVGRRARASNGLLYTRFKDKASLFEAVLIRELTRIVNEENAGFESLRAADLPIADLIEQSIRWLAEVASREARLHQVFMERSMADPALMDHVKRLRTAPRLFAQLLLERRDELARPDPERAADMAFWLANSALQTRVHSGMWRHWDPDAADDWDAFVADLVDALKAFLLTPPRP